MPEMRNGIERAWWTDVEPDQVENEIAWLADALLSLILDHQYSRISRDLDIVLELVYVTYRTVVVDNKDNMFISLLVRKHISVYLVHNSSDVRFFLYQLYFQCRRQWAKYEVWYRLLSGVLYSSRFSIIIHTFLHASTNQHLLYGVLNFLFRFWISTQHGGPQFRQQKILQTPHLGRTACRSNRNVQP